ncbi:Two-component system response regulator DccR [hydrothermal vent metagenome]|uniref:Two-component system response regulator DccR n=1 Tax=hydrothermal vent metagenome TaxID=652676 RepID=A0A1W1D496_9ZZZZ
MVHILYLEDDINLAQSVEDFLESNDFNVTLAYNATQALEMISQHHFDIYLFDINLPDTNGLTFLKELKSFNDTTPTIFITTLNDIHSLDMAYTIGAVDFIRKPFNPKELYHRINTAIQNSFQTSSSQIYFTPHLKFDILHNTLYKNDKIIHLAKKEIELLKILLKYSNQTVSKETIFEQLWNYEENPSDGSLRTYIKNLREILGKEKIVNIKKEGYKLIV